MVGKGREVARGRSRARDPASDNTLAFTVAVGAMSQFGDEVTSSSQP